MILRTKNCFKYKLVITICCFFYGFSGVVNAQDSEVLNQNPSKYRLDDGSRVIGYLMEETETAFVISSQTLGKVSILKENISWIKELPSGALQEDKNGFIEDSYNSVRNVITPTAFALRKKQVYYENVLLGVNSFGVGITDRITLNFGFEAFSILIARNAPGFFVSPKINFPIIKNKLRIATGFTSFGFLDGDYNLNNYAQLLLSYGGRNNNITIGGGYGLQFKANSNRSYPITFAGMWRISRKLSLVTDNVLILNQNGTNSGWVSAVARVHFEDIGASFSFGGLRPTEDRADLVLFPFLSVLLPIK